MSLLHVIWSISIVEVYSLSLINVIARMSFYINVAELGKLTVLDLVLDKKNRLIGPWRL